MRVTSPAIGGTVLRIILGEVVIGDLNGESCVQIAEIFSRQGVVIVLRVACDEEHTAIPCGDDIIQTQQILASGIPFSTYKRIASTKEFPVANIGSVI